MNLPDNVVLETAASNFLIRGPRPMSFDDFVAIDAQTFINLEVGWFEFFHGRAREEDRWADRAPGRVVIHHPLSDFHAPYDWEINNILKTIRVGLMRGNVYIHCLHGVDRTGFVCAKVKLFYGLCTRQAAIEEMLAKGFHTFPYASWIEKL